MDIFLEKVLRERKKTTIINYIYFLTEKNAILLIQYDYGLWKDIIRKNNNYSIMKNVRT